MDDGLSDSLLTDRLEESGRRLVVATEASERYARSRAPDALPLVLQMAIGEVEINQPRRVWPHGYIADGQM